MVQANRKSGRAKRFFRILLALIYLFAGIMHIRSPVGFLQITPDWVPYPEQVILWTGIAEIAGAIGLLIPPRMIPHIRHAAGIGLALYALCVYPANINHAVNNIAIGGETASWLYHAPRLAFQPIFIWWALIAGDVINWPFRSKQP
ncbi:DoxX family protein [uncultured Parasphingorhabdus sp.]|uniref:DoxX family protein n=1 Tax=uncultured Parasphingorhabdus sp. TaxID=2709694 RepID=UPI0030D876C9